MLRFPLPLADQPFNQIRRAAHAILLAQHLAHLSGVLRITRIAAQITQRIGQLAGSQQRTLNGLGPQLALIHLMPPERLLTAEGNDQRGTARAQTRSRGARAAMVNHSAHARE